MKIKDFEFSSGCWPIDENKTSIIFIHGASLSKSFWNHQTKGLSDKFNTIAVDLPGHGRSAPPGKSTIKDYAQDMREFISLLKIQGPVVICGMSMGGAIVQQLLIDNSKFFHAGILINTGARLKVLPAIIDMVNSDYNSYLSSLSMFSISSKSNRKKIDTHIKEFSSQCNSETTLKDFQACNTFDVMEKIPGITSPVLVLSAEDDITTPKKYGIWLTENIEKSTHKHINDAGHFSPIEKPDEINNAIINFIESNKQ